MAAPMEISSVVSEKGSEVQRKLASLAEGDSLQILASLSKEVQGFLRLHPSLILIGSGKVRCGLTGHEMPCKMVAMESYTKGRKYQRLQERSVCDWNEYLPHIIPSKKKGHRHQLFCKLTMRHISREPVDIERHVNGKKYTRALARYQECQSQGIPFKPLCSIPRKDRGERDSDPSPSKGSVSDSEHSESESDDSMSDLYPAADFQQELEVEQLEDDVENVEVQDATESDDEVTPVGPKQKKMFTQKTLTKRTGKKTACPTQHKKLKVTR